MKKREHHAWIVAVSLFLSLFKAFGWSHGRVSWIPGGLSLAIAVSTPISGWVFDRIEARYVMTAGALLTVLGLFCASSAHSFVPLLLSVILIGAGLGGCGLMAASTVIVNWFPERRGMALGIITTGMEAGGMAMALVVGSVIAAHGWRSGYFTLAIPGLLIVVPMLAIFVRTRPASATPQSMGKPADAVPGYEVSEALRTRAYWMLVVAKFSFGFAAGGIFHHLVAYLEGIGYTQHSSTLVISILLGMAAAGKPFMGALGDRIGGKNSMGIGFLIISAGVFLLLSASQPVMLVAWLIIFGLAAATPVGLVPMVLAETLGLKRFGTLFGWLNTTYMAGLFTGPIVVGWMTDMTGGYTKPYEFCSLVYLMGAVASFLCAAPRPSETPVMAKASTSTSTV